MILVYGIDSGEMKRVAGELRAEGLKVQLRSALFFSERDIEACERVVLLSDSPRVRRAYEGRGVEVEDRAARVELVYPESAVVIDADRLPWPALKAQAKAKSGKSPRSRAEALKMLEA